MSDEGELVEWDDDRGFGFIRPDGGGERLFVHIKSIRRMVNRPRIGDRVSYNVGTDRDGRAAAVGAEITGANPLNRDASSRGASPQPRSELPSGATLRLGAAGAVVALVVLDALLLAATLRALPLVYLGAGVVSIAAYWLDKNAAGANRWRIPEQTLHLIDLCFGICGGLVAQALLRHKTSKPQFATVSFAIAAIHFCGLAALAAGLIPQ
jgi:uncharacterized membrane protein YsdA (DUF1294 family)/cold shock CspA family protein